MMKLRLVLMTALVMLMASIDDASAADPHASRRAALVAEISRYDRDAARILGRPTLAPDVLAAIGRTPRHLFVPERLRAHAYDNNPLPIGHGQTISQPYIVALMTDLLDVAAGDTVLEVGTGSGYQAAVLAEMGVFVHSIEIVKPLARRAKLDLEDAGYADLVAMYEGDGYKGIPEHAPYDGIIVTAAPDHVPAPLVEQLKPGAKLVLPVGPAGHQELMLVAKAADGTIEADEVIPVRFVPLTRDE